MKKIFKVFFLCLVILLLLVGGLFLIVRKLDNDAMEMTGFDPVAKNVAGEPTVLPSMFINGERFYIKMPAVNGDTLLAYGDSGGGISMIFPATIDKLGLRPEVKHALLKGVAPMKYIPFRDVVADAHIPQPLLPRYFILRRPVNRVTDAFLFIPPMDEELKFLVKAMPVDIFLAQNFFMGKAWTFDYIHRQIMVNTPIAVTEAAQPGVQKMGFRKNSHGESVFGHPSIVIEVDGEIIEVLFDTGATIMLSQNGKKVFHTTGNTISGSFIAASLFDKWRKLHPDWKYYPKADIDRDIIEVPAIKISGYEVGPVLFARRPDEAWSKGMIETMDKVVRGAIGGSALKYFKVTIDYNSELVKFEKPATDSM